MDKPTKRSRQEQHKNQGSRDDRLDEDLERERLEPGLHSDGTGGAGANPANPHADSNSNT